MNAGSQKIAIVTGCSTGLGRATALELARRGCRVYAAARRPESVEDLRAHGLLPLALDVTDEASIQAAVDEVLRREGRIDILINNAGFGLMIPAADMEPADLRRQLETNVVGAMALVRAVFPGMANRRAGLIVNIGSVSGILSTPFAGAYCASKAALNSLTESLRMEAAPFGIRVVMVQPGGVRSNFAKNAAEQEESARNEKSLYSPIMNKIKGRTRASDMSRMTADEYAKKLVPPLLRKNPPRLLRIGTGSTLYPLVKRLIPEFLLDRVLSGVFGLRKLSRKTGLGS